MFNLNVWDDQAAYLVLDDIPFEFVTGRKAIWGAQKEMTLTDKFRHKRSVKWNKPTIFLGNEGDDFRLLTCGGKGDALRNLAERAWYIENSVIVEIREPMYNVL